MYQVNIGNKILYYPANDDFVIYDTQTMEDVGMAGEFKFRVPPQNPQYEQLTKGEIITIYKNGEEFWRGDIRNVKMDFQKVAEVYCLEDLAWLSDEYLEPAQILTESNMQRFIAAIDAYNSTRPDEKKFTVGYLTNVISTDLCNWTTEHEWSILDSLRNCICKSTGYIRVRRVTGSNNKVTRYIDIVRLEDYGKQAKQAIEYGYNLLDYVKESDYGNLTNVLTPYGDDLETELYEGYAEKLKGTTIQNDASIAAYGRHAKAVVFDNVTDLGMLNALASAYLTRYSQPQLTMEINAIDLAEIENIEEIRIGDSVHIIATPYAVDQWLYLTKIQRDIQNVDRNIITLSGHVQTGRTLTSQMQGTAETVKNLPSKASILDAARRNAYEILNGTEGGYVTFETNADDQIVELRIANNINYSDATKVWRWNLGGLSYQERPNKNASWSQYPPVTAMTMDGGIVANFITAGILTLQHDGAMLRAYDLNNNKIAQIDEDGLWAIKGTIAGFTIKDDYEDQGFIRNDGLIYCKYGFTGWTIGRLINNAYWARADYVPTGGYMKIDYGSLGNGGLWVSNAGNNTYYDMGNHYVHVYATGIYSADYGYAAWTGSDKRIKRNIEDLTIEESKGLLEKLRPRKFEMLLEDGGRMGFVAQEIREVIDDESALEYGDDLRCIHYTDLIAPLVKCINDLYTKIEGLENEIRLMKGEENG